jgi:transcriptional regulator with XRE-family HTH domain
MEGLNMSDIGDRIKGRREELGLSQEDLAKMLGYKHKSSINKIELGEQDVPRHKVPLFAKALDTTPEALNGYGLLREDEASYEWCLLRQMHHLGWHLLYDSEGNVILSSQKESYEITDDDWNTFQRRMVSFMKYQLTELAGGRIL